MGFKGYRVTNELITQALTVGNILEGKYEIVEGVPIGARLVRIDFSMILPYAIFWFEHSDFADSYLEERGEIIVKHWTPGL